MSDYRKTQKHLYGEFARFYVAERCQWAPKDPRRVFDLAFRVIYREYQRRMSPEGLVGVIYEVLAGYNDRPGLFETFDPAMYRGKLAMEDHFLNFFAQKLRGRLEVAVRKPPARVRVGEWGSFPNRPDLGLRRCEARLTASDHRAADLLDAVLDYLDPRERAVIDLLYWGDLSERKVGALLGICHKTVGRLHQAALGKLRRAYGLEVFSEN